MALAGKLNNNRAIKHRGILLFVKYLLFDEKRRITEATNHPPLNQR